jgi:anaerobic magnesium-protoporphyrin IX monomethyl ester cyclase
MADIAFVQRLWYEYPGIGLLSAVLKKHGHTARVIISESPKKILQQIGKPDIAAFSVMTGMHHWALAAASHVKKGSGALTVFGGPHPTYFPEIIERNGVDVICRGEGEYALLDLADAVDNGSDISKIQNLWVKTGGEIHKNPLRPLVGDLDAIPFQDRRLYYDAYPALKNSVNKIFIAGRGCPFECTFCFNERLKKMYSGLGRYVRFRSPANIIGEIRAVRERYPLKTVFFNDDIFILDHKWLERFLPLYRDEVGLPFCVQARADTLNEYIVRLLKDAGCRRVSFAVESGNEDIRKGILGKDITDDDIINAAALLKKFGIRFATYNIVGIPGETVGDALKTVELNVRIKTDYPRCSFLTPYPGTRIEEYAKDMGYLETSADSIPAFSQQSISIIKLKDKNQILNIHSFFQMMVLFPASIPLIRRLIKFPANILFRTWWAFFYIIIFTRSEDRSFRDILSFAMPSLGSFIEKIGSRQ